jgi:cyclase
MRIKLQFKRREILALTKRIIPCLDVKGGKVVKGVHFGSIKDMGDPVSLAKKYSDEVADELVFLDITASEEKRETITSLVSNVAKAIDIPFTVGGGVSSLQDARNILLYGADKVGVNTSAVQNPNLITSIMKAFGKQCVVVAIDAKRNYNVDEDLDNSNGDAEKHIFEEYDNKNNPRKFWYEVFIYGGKKGTGIDAIHWAKKAERMGAGEILLTSIDKDGTQDGYDITLTKSIVDSVPIPVVASGGCGKPEHMVEVFEKTDVSAALAASIFHYDTHGVTGVKKFLKEHGVHVRL